MCYTKYFTLKYTYSALSKNRIEAVTELRNMKTNDVFKYKDQQFINVHDEKNLICITTKFINIGMRIDMQFYSVL